MHACITHTCDVKSSFITHFSSAPHFLTALGTLCPQTASPNAATSHHSPATTYPLAPPWVETTPAPSGVSSAPTQAQAAVPSSALSAAPTAKVKGPILAPLNPLAPVSYLGDDGGKTYASSLPDLTKDPRMSVISVSYAFDDELQAPQP